MKKPEKKHDTGLRILEILKILLDEDLTKNELIEKLKGNIEIENVYTQEAFIKYFNTFELLGLKLKKDRARYGFSTAILKIDLNLEEKEALTELVKFISKFNNNTSEEIISKIFLKLEKYVNLDIEEILKKTKKEENILCDNNVKENLIKTLKDMLYEGQNVSITYRKNNLAEETITVELKEILHSNNNTFIVCYNPKLGRSKKICIDLITRLKQEPNRNTGFDCHNNVTFEIYGRLIRAYKLKEHEKSIDFYSNKIVISNTKEDKDTLLLRLLKYGENCKIISPKPLQEEFLVLTEKMIKNLESYECLK